MYETDALLAQYLDFHYASETPGYLPHHPLLPGVLAFPRRCAELVIRHQPAGGRVLDLGCAVGGASFALATTFDDVIGLDSSRRFIEAAQSLAAQGFFRSSERMYFPPSEPRKTTPRFVWGDAQALPPALGRFEAVLLANLLCRLPDPGACLDGLRACLQLGGTLVITTPCSWDPAFTPPDKWLVPTLDALDARLGGWCDRIECLDLPFVMRDHERRAQFTVALATVWRRRT